MDSFEFQINSSDGSSNPSSDYIHQSNSIEQFFAMFRFLSNVVKSIAMWMWRFDSSESFSHFIEMFIGLGFTTIISVSILSWDRNRFLSREISFYRWSFPWFSHQHTSISTLFIERHRSTDIFNNSKLRKIFFGERDDSISNDERGSAHSFSRFIFVEFIQRHSFINVKTCRLFMARRQWKQTELRISSRTIT